jgi:hypothetical protein
LIKRNWKLHIVKLLRPVHHRGGKKDRMAPIREIRPNSKKRKKSSKKHSSMES